MSIASQASALCSLLAEQAWTEVWPWEPNEMALVQRKQAIEWKESCACKCN